METARSPEDSATALDEDDAFTIIDLSHLDPRDPEWTRQMEALGIKVLDGDDLPRPILRTGDDDAGPYLVVTNTPSGSTEEQSNRALAAAQAVFDAASLDPVAAAYVDPDDPPEREQELLALWEQAEQAATVACWAPREGAPEPTKIDIYME